MYYHFYAAMSRAVFTFHKLPGIQLIGSHERHKSCK